MHKSCRYFPGREILLGRAGETDQQFDYHAEGCLRGILGTGHHSILKIPGEDRYLIAYHRFGTPLEKYPEGKGWNRELCLAPLMFDENGEIMPVVVS